MKKIIKYKEEEEYPSKTKEMIENIKKSKVSSLEDLLNYFPILKEVDLLNVYLFGHFRDKIIFLIECAHKISNNQLSTHYTMTINVIILITIFTIRFSLVSFFFFACVHFLHCTIWINCVISQLPLIFLLLQLIFIFSFH